MANLTPVLTASLVRTVTIEEFLTEAKENSKSLNVFVRRAITGTYVAMGSSVDILMELHEYSKDNVPEDRKIPDGEIERHDIQESEEDTEDDKSLGLSFVSDESENILNGSDINLDDMLEQMDSFIEMSNKRIQEIDEKGLFKSDDEIGWFFEQIKYIQEVFNKFKENL